MRTILTIAVCLAALLGAAPAQAQGYRVIVNVSNPTARLTKDQLERVYLKKTTTWNSGASVAVVDQSARSKVREQFSMSVLGRDVATIKNYWQQSLFSGRGVPPIEQAGDQQVIAFVQGNPNAIGYVAECPPLTDGVKAVEIAR